MIINYMLKNRKLSKSARKEGKKREQRETTAQKGGSPWKPKRKRAWRGLPPMMPKNCGSSNSACGDIIQGEGRARKDEPHIFLIKKK